MRNENIGLPIGEVPMIGKHPIEQILTMTVAIEIVEKTFKLQGEGQVVMPPKLYMDLPEYKGDFRAMPGYVGGSAGIKWVSVYPENRVHGLLTVMASIILCDPYTGYPLAFMDGTYITNMRTGATGGVAAKYLARKDSTVVGMVGGGAQAKTQLTAIKEVLPGIKEVKVFDQDKNAGKRYVEEMRAKLGLNIWRVELIEDVTEADIVVTTTPSKKPIIKKQHIRPGTHINAIGADAMGKQELETDLLRSAKVIVDDIEQACHSGEINVPISEGIIKVEEIYGTLGEIVAGIKRGGREISEEITIFDSTGLAIHDIACAKYVFDTFRKMGS